MISLNSLICLALTTIKLAQFEKRSGCSWIKFRRLQKVLFSVLQLTHLTLGPTGKLKKTGLLDTIGKIFNNADKAMKIGTKAWEMYGSIKEMQAAMKTTPGGKPGQVQFKKGDDEKVREISEGAKSVDLDQMLSDINKEVGKDGSKPTDKAK